MRRRTYIVVNRYFVAGEGWKVERRTLDDHTYEEAAREASRHARELDGLYSDDHFWTVDLTGPDGGAYFQLFHGRLS